METATPFKIEHNGVTITYDEPRNLFCFELRGRQRTAESLAKAREAIDAPPPKEKKPFNRFKAWWNGGRWGSSGWEEVEVTSIAEAQYGQVKEVWITAPDGRHKIDSDAVFPQGNLNDRLVADMLELHKQVDTLHKQADKLKERLKSYEIPKE